jgi:hypothetical protein
VFAAKVEALLKLEQSPSALKKLVMEGQSRVARSPIAPVIG